MFPATSHVRGFVEAIALVIEESGGTVFSIAPEQGDGVSRECPETGGQS